MFKFQYSNSYKFSGVMLILNTEYSDCLEYSTSEHRMRTVALG